MASASGGHDPRPFVRRWLQTTPSPGPQVYHTPPNGRTTSPSTFMLPRRQDRPRRLRDCLPHTIKRKHPRPFYFGYPRPEVVALVPEHARRVLDIGCGAGRLGEAIKQRQAAQVSGIELDQQQPPRPAQRLDQVWAGDVEQLELGDPARSFDAIFCADMLEHLREPGGLLKQAREWLSPDGYLVASIPNVRHHSVVRSLLQGNWTYESAGLLDRTHLRFYTRREIEKLFHRAGFAIDGMWSVNAPGDDPAKRNGSTGPCGSAG